MLIAVTLLVRRLGRIGWGRSILVVIVYVVLCAAVGIRAAALARRTFADSYIQTNRAMEPTLHERDRFVVDRLLAPRRWDVVVVRSPLDPRDLYVKRLVALPGETVELVDGRPVINGKPMSPPEGIVYDGDQRFRGVCNGGRGTPLTLGPDEYYVLGDNTALSADARFWEALPGRQAGALPRTHLVGVARYTYWPWSRLRTFR